VKSLLWAKLGCRTAQHATPEAGSKAGKISIKADFALDAVRFRPIV